jgi:hypothetical protein
METHLRTEQQEKLVCSLRKYPKLFRGGLGVLNVPPVHLEFRPLNRDEKPYHARPFPALECYEDTTKREIQRICSIGVLLKCNDSEWAAPTFIQPKKTGDVRVLTDFVYLISISNGNHTHFPRSPISYKNRKGLLGQQPST